MKSITESYISWITYRAIEEISQIFIVATRTLKTAGPNEVNTRWQWVREKRTIMRLFCVLSGQNYNIKWLGERRNVGAGLGTTPRFLAWACTLTEVINTEEVKVWWGKTVSSLGHVEILEPLRPSLYPE